MEESNKNGWMYAFIALLSFTVVFLGYLAFKNNLVQEQVEVVTPVEKEVIVNEKKVEEKKEDVKKEEVPEKKVEEKVEPKKEVEKTVTHSIEVTSPAKDLMTFTVTPITFEGKVSEGATRIQVIAKGEENGHVKAYSDDYDLETFKKGDREFTYKAKRGWDNLEVGRNDYEFIAYFEDGATETTKINLNYMYDGKGEITFDACGTAEKYADRWWYNDMKARLHINGNYEKAGRIMEICYSDDADMAILITGVNGICDAGSVWRYFVHSKSLQEASVSNTPWSTVCPGELKNFGKRNGNIVPVSGRDDIGCYDSKYAYDLVKHTYWLTSHKDQCENIDRLG